MTDKTTLERCVPFFDKHGMPEGLSGGPGGWIIDGTRGTWVWVTDALATAIIEKHLWEIIQGEAVEVNRNADCSCSPCYRIDVVLNNGVKFTRECPDEELALLLSAAEEAMK